MDEFIHPAKEVYQILKSKNIEFLHHANTLATSLTFIENKSLLSRHYVEENNLTQTEQKSDSEDKLFDVWDYVFLDGEDLHKRYNRANKYGPVLFMLKLDILTSPSIQHIQITKSNPWYWNSKTTKDQKFYKCLNEFNEDYLTGKKLDSQIMFIIKSPNKDIKLNKFLSFIGIDYPKLLVNLKTGGEIGINEYLYQEIKKSLESNSLGHIPILKRHQTDKKLHFCKCNAEYNIMNAFDHKEFFKRFNKHR